VSFSLVSFLSEFEPALFRTSGDKTARRIWVLTTTRHLYPLPSGVAMKNPFPAVMFLFMFVGFVLGGCYLWVKIQVGKAGDRLTFLSREHDTLLFRKYREIAKTKHLSI